jgi:hypothetical protein
MPFFKHKVHFKYVLHSFIFYSIYMYKIAGYINKHSPLTIRDGDSIPYIIVYKFLFQNENIYTFRNGLIGINSAVIIKLVEAGKYVSVLLPLLIKNAARLLIYECNVL